MAGVQLELWHTSSETLARYVVFPVQPLSKCKAYDLARGRQDSRRIRHEGHWGFENRIRRRGGRQRWKKLASHKNQIMNRLGITVS